MKNRILMLIAVAATAGLIVWGCQSGQVNIRPGEEQLLGEPVFVSIESSIEGNYINPYGMDKTIVTPTGEFTGELQNENPYEMAGIKCWFDVEPINFDVCGPDPAPACEYYSSGGTVLIIEGDTEDWENLCATAGADLCMVWENVYADPATPDEDVHFKANGMVPSGIIEFVPAIANCRPEFDIYATDDKSAMFHIAQLNADYGDWSEINKNSNWANMLDADYTVNKVGYSRVPWEDPTDANNDYKFICTSATYPAPAGGACTLDFTFVDPVNELLEDFGNYPAAAVTFRNQIDFDLVEIPTEQLHLEFTWSSIAPIDIETGSKTVGPWDMVWCFVTDLATEGLSVCPSEVLPLETLAIISEYGVDGVRIMDGSYVNVYEVLFTPDAAGLGADSAYFAEFPITLDNVDLALVDALTNETLSTSVEAITGGQMQMNAEGVYNIPAFKIKADAWKNQLADLKLTVKAQLVDVRFQAAPDVTYAHPKFTMLMKAECAGSDNMARDTSRCYVAEDGVTKVAYDWKTAANRPLSAETFEHHPDQGVDFELGYTKLAIQDGLKTAAQIDRINIMKEEMDMMWSPGEGGTGEMKVTATPVNLDAYVSDIEANSGLVYDGDAFIAGLSTMEESNDPLSYYVGVGMLDFDGAGPNPPELAAFAFTFQGGLTDSIKGAALNNATLVTNGLVGDGSDEFELILRVETGGFIRVYVTVNASSEILITGSDAKGGSAVSLLNGDADTLAVGTMQEYAGRFSMNVISSSANVVDTDPSEYANIEESKHTNFTYGGSSNKLQIPGPIVEPVQS